MASKLPLLAYTHAKFSEEAKSRLGKGALHAGLIYEQIMRTGKIAREHPAFANAQTLVDEILALTDLAMPRLMTEHHDGRTGKFLLQTDDRLEIESVLIPMQSGGTLCVSSQVGCRMGCTFCETGRMGLLRNLSTAEIISQIFTARHIIGQEFRNIVFMGMGEPFDNYDNVMQAVRVLTDPKGFGFGKRHITISTSGCVDGIEKLIGEGDEAPNLAVSLNAPNDELRNKIMPINRKYGLQQLYDTMDAYCRATKRQILVAYVLLKDINDSLEHADQLAAYLRGLEVKINLIPYNPQSCDRFASSESPVLEKFTNRLRDHGYYTLLRVTKGQGIMAACGQLGNVKLRQKIRQGKNDKSV